MTQVNENPKEVHMQKDTQVNPKLTKRISTSNVRTMYATGKTAQIFKKMRRYRFDILGISKCRWTGSSKINTQSGETVIYSGRCNDHHSNGVAIVMTKRGIQITSRMDNNQWYNKYSQIMVQVYQNNNYTRIRTQRCKWRWQRCALWTVANGHWQNTTSWYNSPDGRPQCKNQ